MKAVVHLDPPGINRRLLLIILSVWLLTGLINGSSIHLDTATSLAAAKWNLPTTVLVRNRSAFETYHSSVENDLVRLATSLKTNHAIYYFSSSWNELGDWPTETLRSIHVADNRSPITEEKNLHVTENITTQKAVFTLSSSCAVIQPIAAGGSETPGPGPPSKADAECTS